MKEKIMKWYPQLWSLKMVRDAVIKRVITEEEFTEITGQEYK